MAPVSGPLASPGATRPAHPRSQSSGGDGDVLWRLAVRAAARYWPVAVVAALVAAIVVGLRLASGMWWPGGVLAVAVLAAGGWRLPRPVNLIRLAARRVVRPDGGPRLAMWRLRRAAVVAGLLAPAGRLVALEWDGRPGFGWRAVLRCPRGSSAGRWAARTGQLSAALRRDVRVSDLGGGRIEITAVTPDAMQRVPDQRHPLCDPPSRR